MRLVVLYNDADIYVEIPKDKFKEGLIEYYKKFKDIDKAFERLEEDIKKAAKDK